MAKKKRKAKAPVHHVARAAKAAGRALMRRSAAAPLATKSARAAPKRRRRNGSGKKEQPWKAAAALVSGGLLGAGLGGALVWMGANPLVAGIGVTAAGTVGALATDGPLRHVSGGAAAAGTGQLVLGWWATRQRMKAEKAQGQAALPGTRQARITAGDVIDAFERARREVERSRY